MLTDKQRTEMVIPALLMRAGFIAAITPDNRDNTEVDNALLDSINEPLNSLCPTQRQKVLRRSQRIVNEIINEYEDSAIFKIMLMTYFIVKRLTDSGIMELYEGSKFAEALEAIADGLYKCPECADIEPSARKHADKVLHRLHQQGYY